MTYLNCYEQNELEEWLDRVEDLAYADDDEDDYDLRELYYPETLP
jgi:hypothetical protein